MVAGPGAVVQEGAGDRDKEELSGVTHVFMYSIMVMASLEYTHAKTY